MSRLSEADKYLLEQIRNGDQDGWTQLVQRYQGRLVAFARSKVRQGAEAEDLVQDTFISFLKSLDAYREQAGVETYLFTILRRKIVDWFRGRHSSVCALADAMGSAIPDDSGSPAEGRLPDDDGRTPSWYVRRGELRDLQRDALADALRDLIAGYRKSLNFRDLKIVEMLFYCQLRNKDVAAVMDMDEKQIALIKHRVLKGLRDTVAACAGQGFTAGDLEMLESERSNTILADIWQADRLSCPKRTTIGAYLLGTLDPPWADYVAFHIDRLGCTFCRANYDDLQTQTSDAEGDSFRNRILESTVGFLRKS